MQFHRVTIERHGYLIAVASVILATLVFLPGRDHFARGQWALLYLLLVGLVAVLCGMRAALVATVLAATAWNFFFLPPFHTLTITDPKDLLTLAIFAAVGATMGIFAGRMRDRELKALARERETMLLNQLSVHLVSAATAKAMAEAVLEGVREEVGTPCALLTPDEDGRLALVHALPDGEEMPPAVLEQAQWAFQYRKPIGPPRSSRRTSDAGAFLLLLQSSSRLEGVLHVGEHDDRRLFTPAEIRLLLSVANLAAAFLERQRLQETALHSDALREADRMKSTFVSSVSHELKTPLAAVTAAVTSLLEEDVDWDVAAMRGELHAIRHDLDRLHRSIGALLDVARLEADAWEPRRDWYELGEILGTALSYFPGDVHERIIEEIPDDFPAIHVDFQQLVRALQHLLENALAYSAPGSPVRIGAIPLGRHTQIWVQDSGPGVPEEERERIFEKFYRGRQAAYSPAGSGLGLAITAEIVRFHGGRIWVEDAQPRGARFVMYFPDAVEGA